MKNSNKRLKKAPWGILSAVSLMIISFIVIVLVAISIISNAMIANAGGDDGLSELVIFKILRVLLVVLSVFFVASLVLFVIKKVVEKKTNTVKHGIKRSPFVLVTSYLCAWLLVALIGANVANGFKGAINDQLGLTGYRTETIDTGLVDSEYYKSDYVKLDSGGNPIYKTDITGYKHQVYDDEKLHKASVSKADQIQREGTTVLWNDSSNGLPLGKNKKVSVFSHSSVSWVYSGGGSGHANTSNASNVKTAFTNAGLAINETLWNFYATGAGSGKNYTRVARYKMNEVPWSVYDSSVISSFNEYNDAAILVLSRQAGEGSVNQGGAFDVTITEADTPSKDYYDFSNEEKELLDKLIEYKDNGTFKKIIVLLNTPTGMYMEHLMENMAKIDCCLWVGQTGWEGLNEVGRILTGDSIPSGHLVDTFLYNTQLDPTFANSKASLYQNASSMDLLNKTFQGYYTVYQEGIYVGYKYFETRYEDTVLGRGNASDKVGAKNTASNWKYDEVVAFPFGYGASYTTFEYSDFDVKEDANGDYEVTLKVTNTGTKKGQDAVQIYLQKPYTQYDVDNKIEQASVNLVGYYKTKSLNPAESEDFKLTVGSDLLSTYDSNNKKTYIRERTSGEDAYYFTAAEDSHAAVNNILAAKGKTPTNTANMMDNEGNTSLVKRFDFATDDYLTYSVSKETNKPITNQFDDTDWNKYNHKTETNITYLTRSNYKDTYPTSSPVLSLSFDIVNDLSWDKDVTINPEDKKPNYGVSNGIYLIDLMGKDYDDPLWGKLLDQMSLEEQIRLIGQAYKGTGVVASISKPKDTVSDGPLGIIKDFKTYNAKTMSYPNTNLLAATYNDKLAQEMGELQGEDMLHTGVHGLYGPGANIHRNTYSGRNYEYYSEDGYLSGTMLKNVVDGIQSKGCYVNVKHIALNDQEDHRYGGAIWANEQSVREIYLEAFKYTAKDGCTGFMSAFNRLGTTWCGAHKGLCTEVLRNEWGFRGFVISDCAWRAYMGVVDGLLAGNDCILYDATDLTQLYKAKDNPTIAIAMREAVHRILYVTSNSHIMNGLVAGTRVYAVNEWWQEALIGAEIGFGILTGLMLIVTVLIFIFRKKIDASMEKRRQEYEKLEEGDEMKLNGFEKLLGIGKAWNASRIVRTSVLITLVLGIVTGSFFIGMAINKGNNPSSTDNSDSTDTTSNPGGNDSQGGGDSAGEDIHAHLPKEYRFEAEYSEIETTIGSLGTGLEKGRTVGNTNHPSADGYVYNLSKEGQAKLTFKVYSPLATEAKLSIVLGLNTKRDLANIFKYEVNGENIEFDTTISAPKWSTIQYFEWTNFDIANVNLKKGDNEIVLTKVSTGLNFDYLSLTSPVDLEDARDHANHGHNFSSNYQIVEVPTVCKEGIVAGICSNCGKKILETLPKLSTKNGYTEKVTSAPTETEFGYSIFSMRKFNTDLVFNAYKYPISAKEEGYLFEAEDANLSGSDDSTAKISEATDGTASNDKYVGSLAGKTWTISFNITSSGECDALLYMRLGRRNDRSVPMSTKKLLINDEVASIPDEVVLPQIDSTERWNNFEEFEITMVHLKNGVNTFSLSNEGSAFTNLDYFRFVTASNLTFSLN